VKFDEKVQFINIIRYRHFLISFQEEHAVSGRWRELTRAQIGPTSATWRDEFMIAPSHIFKIAEWNIVSQENLIAFEQKPPAIFKAIEDLRLALGKRSHPSISKSMWLARVLHLMSSGWKTVMEMLDRETKEFW
jgi:hypothetical protein